MKRGLLAPSPGRRRSPLRPSARPRPQRAQRRSARRPHKPTCRSIEKVPMLISGIGSAGLAGRRARRGGGCSCGRREGRSGRTAPPADAGSCAGSRSSGHGCGWDSASQVRGRCLRDVLSLKRSAVPATSEKGVCILPPSCQASRKRLDATGGLSICILFGGIAADVTQVVGGGNHGCPEPKPIVNPDPIGYLGASIQTPLYALQ